MDNLLSHLNEICHVVDLLRHMMSRVSDVVLNSLEALIVQMQTTELIHIPSLVILEKWILISIIRCQVAILCV